MKPYTGILLGTVMVIGMSSSSAVSQTAEPTYKADPSVYKLIFEDANFRVIEATHIKGVHDKAHSHGGQFIVYNLTDCTMKTYAPDGKATERDGKAGTVTALPAIASHSAENTGTADCKQIFVEKK
jgi:hypothetical protein